MARYTLAQLLTRGTVEQFMDLLLTIGRFLGLNTTSWLDGEPTKTQFLTQSEYLDSLENNVQGYIAAGFGTFAAADPGLKEWLKLWAFETLGYEAREATFAETEVTLTNTQGGFFPADTLAAGRLTFENTTSNKTYVNSTDASGPLDGVGSTATMTMTANEPGSASNAAVGEIALQTNLAGVVATIESAATAIDEEDSASILRNARNQLGPISPDGPADAFDAIALDPEKTLTTNVTRSRTYSDSTTGDVRQYIAGPSGAVDAETVQLVQDAVVHWATPQCTTPLVSSATNRVINIQYTLDVYSSIGLTEDEIKEVVQREYNTWFPQRPIGGDVKEGQIGAVYLEALKGVVKNAPEIQPHFVDLDMPTPGGNIPMPEQDVPVVGTVTGTVNLQKPS
jgi:hypothetical protein